MADHLTLKLNKNKIFKEEQNQIAYRNNTPYCPEENGKIERFHRTLNDKLISWVLTPRDSLEQIQYQLSLFLQYYNHIKKHRGLGMHGLTPIQKLNQCASVNLTLQCNKTLQNYFYSSTHSRRESRCRALFELPTDLVNATINDDYLIKILAHVLFY